MSMLVFILGYLLVNGIWALNWSFFTELPVGPTVNEGGGLANAIVGSIQVVGFATLFAVLARRAGFPSRIVVGFTPGQPAGLSSSLPAC